MDTQLKETTTSDTSPYKKEKRLLSGQFKTVSTKVSQWWRRNFELSNLFNAYNPSQWCYLTAILILMYSLSFDVDLSQLAALIAFFGLARELINIFHQIWSTTIGKSFVLIVYASTANLALAFAALKINLVTSIEPFPFIFTLGFTTLVLLPFWIALSSTLILLIALIVANLWLLISLPLKLIGIHLKVHWEDSKHALVTMLMRIVLIPVTVYSLMQIIAPYVVSTLDERMIAEHIGTAEKVRKENTLGVDETRTFEDITRKDISLPKRLSDGKLAGTEQGIAPASISHDNIALENTLPNSNELNNSNVSQSFSNNKVSNNKIAPDNTSIIGKTTAVQENNNLESNTFEPEAEDDVFSLQLNSDKQELASEIEKARWIDKIIAHFIFYFEAYPKSACQKMPDQRSVVIDENSILLISKNPESHSGYDYRVAKCEPRY